MAAFIEALGAMIVLGWAVWVCLTVMIWTGDLLWRVFPARRAELLVLRIARWVRRTKQGVTND
jgi:hypothetical protein